MLHLHEIHGIGRWYLDTPPTPSTPSSSWSDDFRIRNAISEGREIGAELDDNSIEKLDLDYSKYLEKEKIPPSIPITAFREKLPRPWSQLVKNSFVLVISIDEFFKDNPDKPYSASQSRSLDQSPCYPIIGVKSVGRYVLYYCEICHPGFANINMSSIEHHCKYKDPERHKVEILSRLEGRLK